MKMQINALFHSHHFYLGHVTQGGQAKYNNECRVLLVLAFLP
jgi:hypothetical protein